MKPTWHWIKWILHVHTVAVIVELSVTAFNFNPRDGKVVPSKCDDVIRRAAVSITRR